MPSPSVTYTFANSTTADATQVNQNFTDLINGMTDGTKDFSINALTCAGSATLNGNVTLGNATGDDVTFTGSLASSIPIKTTNSYDIGSATIGLRSLYLGSSGGDFSTRVIGGAAAASWTWTLPTAVPTDSNSVPVTTTGGVSSWVNRTVRGVVSKTANYTATMSDEVILCSAASAWTLTLPAASTSTGKVYKIKRTDNSLSNPITIDANSSETIDGATTVQLNTQYEQYTLICDGSNWHILDHQCNTPWTSYTPAFIGENSVSWTNATLSGYWRRVSDTIELDLHVSFTGTPGSGTTSFIFGMPSGAAMDTSKMAASSNTGHIGSVSGLDSGTGFREGYAFVFSSGNNYIAMTTGGISSNWGPSVPQTWAINDQLHLRAKLPISNWRA